MQFEPNENESDNSNAENGSSNSGQDQNVNAPDPWDPWEDTSLTGRRSLDESTIVRK
jgi:hypothetical protein